MSRAYVYTMTLPESLVTKQQQLMSLVAAIERNCNLRDFSTALQRRAGLDLAYLAGLNHRVWIDLATRELVEAHGITIIVIDNVSEGLFCLYDAKVAVVVMRVNDVYNPVQFGKQLIIQTQRLYSFEYIVNQSKE